MQEKLMIKRTMNGISKRKMAKMLGITEQAYAQKENNITQFTLNEMFYLSKYFKVSIEELFKPFKR